VAWASGEEELDTGGELRPALVTQLAHVADLRTRTPAAITGLYVKDDKKGEHHFASHFESAQRRGTEI